MCFMTTYECLIILLKLSLVNAIVVSFAVPCLIMASLRAALLQFLSRKSSSSLRNYFLSSRLSRCVVLQFTSPISTRMTDLVPYVKRYGDSHLVECGVDMFLQYWIQFVDPISFGLIESSL